MRASPMPSPGCCALCPGMRAGASQVENGVSLVEEARQALQRIKAQMTHTLEMVNDITHSSSEQQNAMQVMAQSVEQVAAMTDQNMAVVAQTHGAVGTLELALGRMRKSVGQFAV